MIYYVHILKCNISQPYISSMNNRKGLLSLIGHVNTSIHYLGWWLLQYLNTKRS